MIKTEAALAKLTARQREVLIAVVRQLSKDKVARFSQIAEDTTNIDAEATPPGLRHRARGAFKTGKLDCFIH